MDRRAGERSGETRLEANSPNPCNAGTVIPFAVAQTGMVRLDLYDLAGQRVRSLVHQVLPAGAHRVFWDGRDRQGWPVATGVYLYTLTVGQQRVSRRLVVLK